MRYVPVLKARRAELKALSTETISNAVEPVFELQHTEWDPTKPSGKSVGTDAAAFIDGLRRNWWEPAFVDLTRVAVTSSDRSAWWATIHALLNMPGIPPHSLSPVLIPSDTRASLRAAQPLAYATGRALLRVPAPHPSLASLKQLHGDFAKQLKLSQQKLEVLIDWGDDTETHTLDDMTRHVLSIDSAFNGKVPLITAGTPDTSVCAQEGAWDFNRREWWLWLKVIAAQTDLTFGDYALFPPPSPGWGTPKYGHLRYSVDDRLHVERRQTSYGGLSAGFKLCCDHLIAQKLFAGPGYSLGDRQIGSIAASTEKPPGNSEQWRMMSLQHHLRLVDDQLTTAPPPPPAGTL